MKYVLVDSLENEMSGAKLQRSRVVGAKLLWARKWPLDQLEARFYVRSKEHLRHPKMS
jgi:hypothetical protein